MDKKLEHSAHDLKDILAEKRKHIFPATVLNQGNQRLSKGEAIVEGSYRVYWPYPPEPMDSEPASVTVLRHSDGTETEIADFHLCDSPSSSVHYHFRIV
jgi:hypothetical protein